MSKASLDTLELLHASVAEKLAERLAGGEWTAADMAQAIKFLKDNNIEVVAGARNAPLQKLADILPFPTQVDDEGRPLSAQGT